MTLTDAIKRHGLGSDETGRALLAYVRGIVYNKMNADNEKQREMIARCVAGGWEALSKNRKKLQTENHHFAERVVRSRVASVFRTYRAERKREGIFLSLLDVEEYELATKQELLLVRIRDEILDEIGIKAKCKARKMALDVLQGRREISSYSAEDQRTIKTFVWRIIDYVDPDPSP